MSLRKRSLRVAVLLVIAGGFGAAVLWLGPRPGSGVTSANYNRLRAGMLLRDVELILGGSPGDYRSGPTLLFSDLDCTDWVPDEEMTDVGPPLEWITDTALVRVHFGVTGLIRGCYLTAERRPQSLLDNLRWRLGQSWARWTKGL